MYEYKAMLKRVIDGDTIDVLVDLGFSITMEMRLRLADVDTPELRSQDESERDKAQAAKKFVEDFIGEHGMLVITTHKTAAGKERTTFGRYVADVWVVQPGSTALGADAHLVLLNSAIVEAGHGKYV